MLILWSTTILPDAPVSAPTSGRTGARRGMTPTASHGTTSPPTSAASTRAEPIALSRGIRRTEIPSSSAAAQTASRTQRQKWEGRRPIGAEMETLTPERARASATDIAVNPQPASTALEQPRLASLNSENPVGSPRKWTPLVLDPGKGAETGTVPVASTAESYLCRPAGVTRVASASTMDTVSPRLTLTPALRRAVSVPRAAGAPPSSILGQSLLGTGSPGDRSKSVTRAPSSHAANAADAPAGPPPTTHTLRKTVTAPP